MVTLLHFNTPTFTPTPSFFDKRNTCCVRYLWCYVGFNSKERRWPALWRSMSFVLSPPTKSLAPGIKKTWTFTFSLSFHWVPHTSPLPPRFIRGFSLGTSYKYPNLINCPQSHKTPLIPPFPSSMSRAMMSLCFIQNTPVKN